jgi:hypothetical protein
MDTRLKKTPLPAPSLSFLTKNFNDDTQEIKYHSDSTPAFETLGLQQNDLEYESLDQFPTEPPLHEKQRQRKVRSFVSLSLSSSIIIHHIFVFHSFVNLHGVLLIHPIATVLYNLFNQLS